MGNNENGMFKFACLETALAETFYLCNNPDADLGAIIFGSWHTSVTLNSSTSYSLDEHSAVLTRFELLLSHTWKLCLPTRAAICGLSGDLVISDSPTQGLSYLSTLPSCSPAVRLF